MKPKLIVILTAILLFLIVLTQNTYVITLRLFFWQISMSQVLLILFTIILGFAAGYITAVVVMKMEKRPLRLR